LLFRCDNPDGNCEQEGELKQYPSSTPDPAHRSSQVGPATGVVRMPLLRRSSAPFPTKFVARSKLCAAWDTL
jgi:hypothetical protein